MPPKKRNTPFQAHHVAKFGLQICERAVGNSTAVVTTSCRFCEVFEKEELEVGMKRGHSKRVKYFKAPFREIIFNTFAKAMDVLFPDWRETIIGASSDGEKKMTRRH
ncbi:unnamed protein product [Sphagnum troendelagicum]